MTLLTKITNEAINENLMKRWQNGEIYASYFPGKDIQLATLLLTTWDDRLILATYLSASTRFVTSVFTPIQSSIVTVAKTSSK